jgi:hypothetical protein
VGFVHGSAIRPRTLWLGCAQGEATRSTLCMGWSGRRSADGWALHKGATGGCGLTRHSATCLPSGVGTKRRHARAASSSTPRIDGLQGDSLYRRADPKGDFPYRRAHAGPPVSTRPCGTSRIDGPSGIFRINAAMRDRTYRRAHAGPHVSTRPCGTSRIDAPKRDVPYRCARVGRTCRTARPCWRPAGSTPTRAARGDNPAVRSSIAGCCTDRRL